MPSDLEKSVSVTVFVAAYISSTVPPNKLCVTRDFPPFALYDLDDEEGINDRTDDVAGNPPAITNHPCCFVFLVEIL